MSAELDRLAALGAAAYPQLAEPTAYRPALAAQLAAGVKDLRAADMFLACACAAADPRAIAVLDAELPSIVRPALAKIGVPPSDDDEIVQRVRVALLAPEAGAAGIASYSGRGDLRAYIRAVAVRLGLKRLQRERGPSADDPDELAAVISDAGDPPELALAKQQSREALRAAFASAVASLGPRERTLLRQHYVDGLTIDALAPLHQVHRATCARWLDAAREKILRGIRRHLREVANLDATEVDRVVGLASSQLDLSLSRHLASGS